MEIAQNYAPEGTCLSVKGLAVARGGRLLLRRVNCSLRSGDALYLRGSNGVGKSSLMRVLAGLLPAFSGHVSRHGTAALVNDQLALDTLLPLNQAMCFWAKLDGAGPDDVQKALLSLAMENLQSVPVRMLSTGQRKKAALATLIVSGAPIWLLDEPASGLDVASVGLLETLISAHRQRGGIIIAVSHQPLNIPGALELDLNQFSPVDEEST